MGRESRRNRSTETARDCSYQRAGDLVDRELDALEVTRRAGLVRPTQRNVAMAGIIGALAACAAVPEPRRRPPSLDLKHARLRK